MAKSILEILFRTLKQGDGDKQAAGGLKNVQGAFEKVTGVTIGAAGALALVGGALRYSISQAVDSEKANAQLNATLESTKWAAGLSADELDRLATSLSSITAIDDDLIKGGESLMLTFTKIGSEVFPSAMTAALDMSAALGQDLQSSVIQLGKALNDPIQGVTALRRVGVSFNETQLETIKGLQESGDLMGAQRLILEELSTEFGGSAAAAADTYAGKMQKLQNNVDNLAEKMGTALLPILSRATDTMILLTEWNSRVTGAIEDQKIVIENTATSYEDYVQQNIGLAKSTGVLDKNFVILTDDTLQMAEDTAYLYSVTGMMTQAQWEASQATEAYQLTRQALALVEQDSIPVTDAAAESARGIAEGMSAAAGEAGLAATSAHEMAGAAERLAAAEGNLKTAQEDLAKAQENWKSGAGGQVAGMLEAAGVGGDKLYAALGPLDEVMGTNLLTTQKEKDAMQLLVDQYKRTGDVLAFKEGLIKLQETFMPLNKDVESSMKLVDQLQEKLNALERTYTIHVRTVYDDPGPGGGGGDGGGGGACFVGGTPVTTPGGMRPIAEIKVGEEICVLEGAGKEPNPPAPFPKREGGEEGPVVYTRAKVKHRILSERDDLVRVYVSDGQQITCSPNHPWMVLGGGWCWARALEPGVLLVSDHGEVHVERVEPVTGSYPVYNLTISHKEHTFLVGGLVVHNVEAKASGGPVSAGRMYLVGEEGPETLQMTPGGRAAGKIIPNGGASGGVTIGQVVINNGMDVEELIYRIQKKLG